MKGNFTFVSVLISLVLGVSLAACKGESEKKQVRSDPALPVVGESEKKQVRSDPVLPVVVGRAQKVQEKETISVSGTVSTPNSSTNASFLVSGKVMFVRPREGDFVKKGQVLASIDPTDYQLALAADKARKDQAEIAYERAEDEHRRMKMLYDSKSLAPNDYLKFKAAFDSAAQQYEQAVASEKLTRKRLTDATLYAPTSGYIAKRLIEPGNSAAPGHPVFEIVQMDPVEVNVGIPETDVHLVRLGQKTDITVPAQPGKSFQGTVRVINVSADPHTRTYMARITVANPENSLRIGMVAEATIRGDRTVSMVTLPGEAVVRDPQGATQVFVYYPDQKSVYTKRVEIGAAAGRDIEIKSGLAGDELIVLAGQGKLRNGMVVSATERTRPN